MQYLWEFSIGMLLAEKLENKDTICIRLWQLVLGAGAGIGIAALAFGIGGILRTFNDVPALIGYGALALLLYSIENNWIKKVVLFVSVHSYTLYLVHILVFSVIFEIVKVRGFMEYVVGVISFLCAMLMAILYHKGIAYSSARFCVR